MYCFMIVICNPSIDTYRTLKCLTLALYTVTSVCDYTFRCLINVKEKFTTTNPTIGPTVGQRWANVGPLPLVAQRCMLGQNQAGPTACPTGGPTEW